MSEFNLRELIQAQNLIHNYNYVYEKLEGGIACVVHIEIPPSYKDKVIYLPCVARGYPLEFKLKDTRI